MVMLSDDIDEHLNNHNNKDKKRTLEDIYKNGPIPEPTRKLQKFKGAPLTKIHYDDLLCKICKKGDGDSEMLICDECDEGFHMYCLCPILIKVPKGKWFCKFCSRKDKIIDAKFVRRRRRHGLCIQKKSRKILPHIPSKDLERRWLQMASLATALTSTNVEYSNELTYLPRLAPKSANRAANERGGMQVIGKEDLETLKLCKKMVARGECPPLMVNYDPREGFVVEADNHIKDMTLIAEYTGDVDYMFNRLNDDSDNLMGLLFPHDSSKELVICPDKRGNIARFISGINNHSIEGKRKQNLRCVRYDINGQARVLLVSIRDIAKGERLYYDYNAYHKEYPTQHFV